MKIKSKVNIDDRLVDFEFEGTVGEIDTLDSKTDKIKQCLIKLAKN